MSDKEIEVRISADIAAFKTGMGQAASITEQASARIRAALQSTAQAKQSMSELANSTQAATTQISNSLHLTSMKVNQTFVSIHEKAKETEKKSILGTIKDKMLEDGSKMCGSLSGVAEELVKLPGPGMVAGLALQAAFGASKLVEGAAKTTEAAMQLGRVMGTTTNEAQQWNIAAQSVGATQEDLEGATKGMSDQLTDNEAAMRKLGLQTRDAKGHLRPMSELMKEGIGIVNDHKDGLDRAQVAQTIFGDSVTASSKLLGVNKDVLKDAQNTMQEYGLEVGQESVKAFKEYDDASQKVSMALKGMGNVIGQALMPIATKLINGVLVVMPYVLTGVRLAIASVVAVFLYLKNGINTVIEIGMAFYNSFTAIANGISKVFERIKNGDWSGAVDEAKAAGSNVAAAWSNAMDNIAQNTKNTNEEIKQSFSDALHPKSDSAPGKPEDNPGYKDAPKPKKAGGGGSQSNAAFDAEMARFAKELEAAGNNADKKLQIAEKEKIELLKKYKETSQEYKKFSDKYVQIAKDAAAQKEQLEKMAADSKMAKDLAAIDAEEVAFRSEVDLAKKSKEELLQAEEDFEQRRYKIRDDALQAQKGQINPDTDPVKYKALLLQIEELQREHEKTMAKIKADAALQAKEAAKIASGKDGKDGKQEGDGKEEDSPAAKVFKSMEDAFSEAAKGILNKATTLREGLKNVFKAVQQTFMQEMVVKPLTEAAMRMVKESAIYKAIANSAILSQTSAATKGVAATKTAQVTKGAIEKAGLGEKIAIDQAGAESGMVAKAEETTANVGMSAIEAAANAFKALAGIPIIGPALAVGAAAAAMSTVMGFLSGGGESTTTTTTRIPSSGASTASIPSAAGGFDIPAGVNPLTQLHEREMVLPAEHADTIRALAAGGAGGDVNVNINAHPMPGNYFMVHKRELVAALKSARRDFSFA